MHHLPAERLAALADEAPSAGEREHLAACAACCRERESYDRLRELASHESTRLAPALSDWTAIAAGLRREGVLAPTALAPGALTVTDTSPVALGDGEAADDLARRRPRRVSDAWWTRAAAAILLLAGGVVGGRISAGASPLGAGPALARSALDTVTVVVGDTLPVFHSAREALAHLTSAEKQYQYAAEFLGQLDTTGNGAARGNPDSAAVENYQTRLTALDNVMAATRQALYTAPHDPVINRYYLATLGAREATIRQLNTVLPAGEQVSHY